MDDLRIILEDQGEGDLLLTNKEIRERDNARFILYHMRKWYIKKKTNETRNAAALRIQKMWKGRFIRNSSFINALELGRYPMIYFLKE
jgi:hypothetical protein